MTRRALAALALTAGLLAAPGLRAQDTGWTAGPAIPRVTLLDAGGRGWPLRDLMAEGPVLVGFFFTGCGTVCPLQTATMQAVQQELARRGTPALLLSISLDPLGDSPAAMRRYAGQFGLDLGREAGWLMLTGPPEALAPVWAGFGEGAGAAADHTAMLWIGQPQHRRWTRVGAMAPPERIADLLLEPAP